MKRRVIVASILGSTFLLGLGGCLINKNFNSNANPNCSTHGQVDLIPDDVVAGEVPDYFTILCPIKTTNFSYDTYKDKDFVLCYDVNGQFESKNIMEMKVAEYESDGTTPKTVYFESEVVGRVKGWITYSIYAIDKDCPSFDVPSAGSSEYDKTLITHDIYECGFEEQEKKSPYDTVVDLKSSLIKPEDAIDEVYAKLTYSINGGPQKTLLAQKEYKVIPGTAIFTDFSYEAQIFANKGDVIEYTVAVPYKDGSVNESVQKVVVK